MSTWILASIFSSTSFDLKTIIPPLDPPPKRRKGKKEQFTDATYCLMANQLKVVIGRMILEGRLQAARQWVLSEFPRVIRIYENYRRNPGHALSAASLAPQPPPAQISVPTLSTNATMLPLEPLPQGMFPKIRVSPLLQAIDTSYHPAVAIPSTPPAVSSSTGRRSSDSIAPALPPNSSRHFTTPVAKQRADKAASLLASATGTSDPKDPSATAPSPRTPSTFRRAPPPDLSSPSEFPALNDSPSIPVASSGRLGKKCTIPPKKYVIVVGRSTARESPSSIVDSSSSR